VHLASRVIVGVEALVRLRGADGALVAPDRFIAVAERSGLIGVLGEQVRQEAMETAAAWKRALPDGRPFGLGVNLSVSELAGPGLVQSVRQSLRTSGLEPSALNLEITESAFMEEGRGHERVLAELRETGARLYLDDFGTGFSSLSYLRRFPVDGLKIDRTFVADLAPGTAAGTLTAAIVHLARELGVGVVAEGVETEEQAQALLAHGCWLAQGYLLARPGPAEVVQALLLPAPRLPRDADVRTVPGALGRVD
jgi:EAL domain-containing protein (putative c-di-GMP-specific phosphodiesterase class I)